MRLLLLALLYLITDPVHAQGPFAPPGVAPPDYVATRVATIYERDHSRTVLFHHANWTRISLSGDTPYGAYYFGDVLKISADSETLSITRNPDRFRDIDYTPRNTGERQTHLGESCTIWEVARSRPNTPLAPVGIDRSCVTDDGIELWRKTENAGGVIFSSEATGIERRPVSAEESRPPPSAFSLDWADSNVQPPMPPEKPDHEVAWR